MKPWLDGGTKTPQEVALVIHYETPCDRDVAEKDEAKRSILKRKSGGCNQRESLIIPSHPVFISIMSLLVLAVTLPRTAAVVHGRTSVGQRRDLSSHTRPPAARPVRLRIDGQWYDASGWADKHPGGRYVLDWADGFDVSGAFHTIHIFSSKRVSDILATLPRVEPEQPNTQQPIQRVPPAAQSLTGMDRFMAAGERVVQLCSPPDPAVLGCEPPPVVGASALPWQQTGDHEGGTIESALKRDLEALLRRRFASPAEYKATPEHWARIVGALAVWAVCFGGWLHGSTAASLLLPFAQWLVFSPTVSPPGHHQATRARARERDSAGL